MHLIHRLKAYRIRFAKERPGVWHERRYRLGDRIHDSIYRCPVAESTVSRMERTYARLHKISAPCYRPGRIDHWVVSLVKNLSLFPRAFEREKMGDPTYRGLGAGR